MDVQAPGRDDKAVVDSADGDIRVADPIADETQAKRDVGRVAEVSHRSQTGQRLSFSPVNRYNAVVSSLPAISMSARIDGFRSPASIRQM